MIPRRSDSGAYGSAAGSFIEKLSAFEQKANNRFELTENFLKANIHMVKLANEKTNEENLHLFKKVGSNFKILDRTVFFEPRSAWRTLSDQIQTAMEF